MKICLVTTFPPSQGGLSEYGLHIAHELQRNPFISLTVLADEISPALPELEGYSVLRCWSFDDPRTVSRLLRTLHRQKPDVVWFNLLFSTFGRNPLNAFAGLMSPLLARLSGRYTHVTLHHLIDTVDLKDAGVRFTRTYQMAGAVATRMLLLSNSVSVLMPGYRKILQDKYGRDNVHVRSHGILTRRPEFPDFSRRGNPGHRILAFGKWGTYKRLEMMIEAFALVTQKIPDVKLVIGGGDHPQAAGYVESVKKACSDQPNIEFTGYVHEEDLPNLFQAASVAAMPYTSSTGCSGVAHLACAYGVPVVCADLPDFRQMAQGEDLAIEFYKAGSAQALADCLISYLQDPEKQRAMAMQNFSAALRMTMPNIVQKYLRHFELHQRTEALRYVTRFRRLPNWVPSKSFLLRIITRKSLSWVNRPALPSSTMSRHNGKHLLLNGNANGGRNLGGSGTPVDGDGVIAAGGNLWRGSPPATARAADHAETGQQTDGQEFDATLAPQIADQYQTSQAKGKSSASQQWVPFPLGQIHAGNGNGRNGKNGSSRAGAGSNGLGGEGATEAAGESSAGKIEGIVERSGLGLGSNGEGP
jgi:glycosyltransferase involved in cell wall biosynthesis